MYRVVDVEVEPGTPVRCYSPPELAIHEGDLCIVTREKVLEFGRIVNFSTAPGEMPRAEKSATVLRRATLQDQSRADENALMSKMAVDKCSAAAEKHGFKIRLVRVRYSFDRGVLAILFSADEKLDVRELAQDLGQELRTRVELKQIGVRDEAAIIGGVGSCGRQLCCCTWLHKFASINVKMAKTQGLSLNPGAIGGNCGRLKCCLNYERDHYLELEKGLPGQGARVECPSGEGCVVERNILAQRLRVRLDDDRILDCGATEVKEIPDRTRSAKRRPVDENPGVERPKPEPTGQA
jgi:cell fate regulator YaaT (PSP1 superfamily)